MEFNSYIWQLYRDSSEGSMAIDTYSNLLENVNKGQFKLTLATSPVNTSNLDWELINSFIETYSSRIIKDLSEAENLFNEVVSYIIEGGGDINDEEEPVLVDAADILYILPELSMAFNQCFPEYFFPYFFRGHFYLFEEICEIFTITLPELPKKKHYDQRLAYYFELCRALYEFRKSSNLSPAELSAFLYSFAQNFISVAQDNVLPKPLKVWIVSGGINQNGDFEYLDGIDDHAVTSWQGNIDTRRGDIVLVYCLSPRSYIHSIWRAKTDGYIDPFFYFYNQVWLCNPIKTTHITYDDLRNDPLLSQNSLVKCSMQGLNGRRFNYREYEAILSIMESKGQDLSKLPRVEPVFEISDGKNLLVDERDVEIYLVEPLLEKLGYENEDWTRQMTVRMGRGEKLYPDYAFFAQQNKGEEQARMVLETKYRIKTNKELFNAYSQAKSYALRLQSTAFVVAAIEGIWIFPLQKSGFEFETNLHKTWKEVYQPDIFSAIIDVIGKQAIKKKKTRNI